MAGGLGVEDELGAEGVERGKAALGAEAAQEGEGDDGAVDVGVEVEYMRFNGAYGVGRGVDGGAEADVYNGASGCGVACEGYVGGVCAVGGQKLASAECGGYICSWKADGAPEVFAAYNSTVDYVWASEQCAGSVEIGVGDGAAQRRAACRFVAGAWWKLFDVYYAERGGAGGVETVAAYVVVKSHCEC